MVKIIPPKPGQHVHKYRRTFLDKAKKYEVMQCADPTCSHYIPKSLAKGKFCRCWGCDKAFLLTARALLAVHPKCGCTTTLHKKAEKIREEQGAILDELLSGGMSAEENE